MRCRFAGWYFLPAAPAPVTLAESIVDLRELHTIERRTLEYLVDAGERVCRIRTPWREHLAQAFGHGGEAAGNVFDVVFANSHRAVFRGVQFDRDASLACDESNNLRIIDGGDQQAEPKDRNHAQRGRVEGIRVVD